MHEIERKYLMLSAASQIERAAAANETLTSRRLIQQRYLPPAGWRLRAKRVPTVLGQIVTFSLRSAKSRLDFTMNDDAWQRLVNVAPTGRAKAGDPPGTLRLNLDDLSAWTIRIRRSTAIAGNDVRCFLTLKRKVSMATCIEIESPILEMQHEACLPLFGPAVRKRRICVKYKGHIWEIDSFLNPELAGLEIAEVELACEETNPALPAWCGREVTNERGYKNAKLVRRIAA